MKSFDTNNQWNNIISEKLYRVGYITYIVLLDFGTKSYYNAKKVLFRTKLEATYEKCNLKRNKTLQLPYK